MLPKRKQVKEGYDELLSFKLIVGKRFKTGSQSADTKKYTISQYNEHEDKFEVTWYDVQLGKRTGTFYDRKDVVKYIQDRSWILLNN